MSEKNVFLSLPSVFLSFLFLAFSHADAALPFSLSSLSSLSSSDLSSLSSCLFSFLFSLYKLVDSSRTVKNSV